MKLTKDQQNYLEASRFPGVKVIDKAGNKMEIECSKK
jgi:hypothetical protein